MDLGAGSADSDQVAAAPSLDGLVIHEAGSGRIFQLNETEARAWYGLRAGDDPEAVVEGLAHGQSIDRRIVRRDVRAFAGTLKRAGLIRPKDAVELWDVVAEPTPRPAPALRACYRVGEVTAEIACYPGSIAGSFSRLAVPVEVGPDLVPEVRVTLHRDRGAFVLTRDGHVVDRQVGAPAARWALVRALVSAGRRRRWLALLHASAVATPAGCLVLCGDSGAGKSTLLAGLLFAGFEFVTDDILPLEAGTGLVWPVGLAISIKQGSWPTVDRMFPHLADAPVVRFGGRAMRYLWPGDDGIAVATTSQPAAALIFPRIDLPPLCRWRCDLASTARHVAGAHPARRGREHPAIHRPRLRGISRLARDDSGLRTGLRSPRRGCPTGQLSRRGNAEGRGRQRCRVRYEAAPRRR